VRPERLPEPGRPIATSDDSTAIVLNPANLAFGPDSELRWSSVYLEEQLSVPWQGHAVGLSARLPFLNLSTGLRLDLLAPPDGTGLLVDLPYQWLTWALGLRISRKSALGFSLQGSFSESAFANDLGSFSLGYSHRPFDALAISLVAHDLSSPNNGFNELNRSYDAAVSVRPEGTRALEIALENNYIEDDDIWTPQVGLGIDLPHVGRLRGDFAISNPTRESERAWLASAGVSFYLNGMGGSSELSAGAISGDGLGASDSYNLYTSFAARGFREPVGVEPNRYAVKIRIEDTPEGRVHTAFLRQLWSLADEANVDAVVFELRASPGNSLARIQELRDAVYELRRAGKRTMCHLEDGSGAAMYFCAATNKTYVNPAGGLRFSGLRSEHMYFARLLKKLGIRAEFVRIGPHKSAPEQFGETRATDVSRADKIDLLQQYERHFVDGIALGRNMSVADVRARLKEGPFIAREAKEANFVDGYAYDDQIQKKLNELTGRPTPLKADDRARTAQETFGNEGFIAVVHIDGDMVDGRSRSIPFLGMGVTGSYTIAETLKAVRENPQFKAVVLRVDTPGGSSMAADVIWRQVQLTAKVKPTVVSMGTVAASGGYYVSAPATRVFANPLSVTGSIGVFYAKADLSELLDRIGVDIEVYKTQPHADAESFYRPFTPEERTRLETKVAQFYQLFLGRVAEGRKMTKEAVDRVAQGRVWTGEQALAHGLVDELGGFRQAVAYARQKAGVSAAAPLVDLPVIKSSFLSRLIGMPGLKQSLLDAPMPKGFSDTLRALGPFVIHADDKPLARIDFSLSDFE
jgi:protease-4